MLRYPTLNVNHDIFNVKTRSDDHLLLNTTGVHETRYEDKRLVYHAKSILICNHSTHLLKNNIYYYDQTRRLVHKSTVSLGRR